MLSAVEPFHTPFFMARWTMETKASNAQKTSIRLELTEDQRARVREALGKEAKAVELTAEPLEERVNPIIAILIG